MSKFVKISDELVIRPGDFNIIAGPCAIENVDQMDSIGQVLVKNDIKILRGGVFKPRTNPDSFQGLREEGYKILKYMKERYGLLILSEVVDPRDLNQAMDYIDIIQIGSRNMQNFSLLTEVGKIDRPIMLKRGMSATIEEWIGASKYIEKEGNDKIIFCERGIRTFEPYTRNTLDIMAVPIMKKETTHPIFVDPSHGTGHRFLIEPAIKAARAVGANGVVVEIHPDPDRALSDGAQSLNLEEFQRIVTTMKTGNMEV